MNVAFVLRAFGGAGGTEKYAADLATWLVAAGHEVHVYAARSDDAAVAASGVIRHRLPGARGGLSGAIALRNASVLLPRDRHDLVQGFGWTAGHDVYRAGGGVHEAALEAVDDTAIRRLISALSPMQRWARAADRAAAVQARLVVCNAERPAAELRQRYGLEEGRVRVVRNGVDGSRFRPDARRRDTSRAIWGVPPGGRVALFLGTGFHRKGLSTAVAAFARAAGPRDRLVVIGRDGRARSRLTAARSVVGDRLVTQGAVTDPETWLPGADAVILPTRYDAASNSTLEALSCGVPAITSGRDGSAEVVPDPAWVVSDPNDAVGFAEALGAAWEAVPGVGDRCREAVVPWTVARNGSAMEAIYQELARG